MYNLGYCRVMLRLSYYNIAVLPSFAFRIVMMPPVD